MNLFPTCKMGTNIRNPYTILSHEVKYLCNKETGEN